MVKPKRTNADLVKAAAALASESEQDIAFYPNWAANAAMPYKDPGAVQAWGKRNGALSVVLQPGMVLDADGNAKSVGYPFGVVPRILLAWMSTEAVRTRSPTLQLGPSVRSFLTEKLHMKPTGGKTGSIPRVREQGMRLFRAHFHIDLATGDQEALLNLNIVSAFDVWWESGGQDGRTTLKDSVVVLTQEFFDRLLDNPVPVDMGAIQALSGSALRLDIYMWLTYRMSYLNNPTTISWRQLSDQFGTRLADTPQGRAQFRRDFIKHLKQVLIVYPAARVEILDTGIKLMRSPTHVAFRGLRDLSRGTD